VSTPGPWKSDGVRIFGAGVALASTVEGRPGLERNENAHLMAAAPVLRDACERVLAWLDSGEKIGTFRRADADAIREALRLAKGE
jgi:hypothetical protein